jgi:hypothetical protein
MNKIKLMFLISINVNSLNNNGFVKPNLVDTEPKSDLVEMLAFIIIFVGCCFFFYFCIYKPGKRREERMNQYYSDRDEHHKKTMEKYKQEENEENKKKEKLKPIEDLVNNNNYDDFQKTEENEKKIEQLKKEILLKEENQVLKRELEDEIKRLESSFDSKFGLKKAIKTRGIKDNIIYILNYSNMEMENKDLLIKFLTNNNNVHYKNKLLNLEKNQINKSLENFKKELDKLPFNYYKDIINSNITDENKKYILQLLIFFNENLPVKEY